ncbi:MAG: hypothetical protein EF813_11810 [Methanosarcinales archaeon]|nr:MAG: hypothetical protein EF813_11810 [Methanosarcinales archaeon]
MKLDDFDMSESMFVDANIFIVFYDANILEIDMVDRCRAYLGYFTESLCVCGGALGEFERREYRSVMRMGGGGVVVIGSI